MKTNKLILLGLICLTVAMPTTAQNRNEKKERTERAVKEAIAAKQYKINVDRMQPMRGGSRNLTTNYTLEIRNDSVFSYLPYFGVAYNAPYGGGKSLNFNASITGYTTRALKKGKIQIDRIPCRYPVLLLHIYRSDPDIPGNGPEGYILFFL